MVKKIHCIKIGDMGDFELSCIESWKRVYPDFEIVYWGEEELAPLAQDCEYAKDNYAKGRMAYVIDYVRLKILYEHGGIYMDTDVFAVNRIPDRYFEKPFLTWDDKICCTWTNNGCITYCPEKNPIFLEFIEKYKTLEYNPDSPWHNNWPIDNVLKEHGVVFGENPFTESMNDKDVGDLVIVNRIQFGANEYLRNHLEIHDGMPTYLIHCHSLSWMGPFVNDTCIYYSVLNDDTDIEKLEMDVDKWIAMKQGRKHNCLVLYANTLSGIDNYFSKKLNALAPRQWSGGNKFWFIFPIGCGLSRDEERRNVTDILARRFRDIVFCREIGR